MKSSSSGEELKKLDFQSLPEKLKIDNEHKIENRATTLLLVAFYMTMHLKSMGFEELREAPIALLHLSQA